MSLWNWKSGSMNRLKVSSLQITRHEWGNLRKPQLTLQIKYLRVKMSSCHRKNMEHEKSF